MSKVIYRPVAKTTYDFSGMSTANYTLAKGIDLSSYREGTLIVRFHNPTYGAGAANPAAGVYIYQDELTDEDPATSFPGIAVATTGLVSLPPTIPSLVIQPLSVPFGQVAVVLSFQCSQTGVAYVTLSVDIVGKS